MDVLADGVWEQFFTEKPEPLTREEKRAWLDTMTGVSLGSDAFFPFGDNIERAHKERCGIYCAAWRIHPGRPCDRYLQQVWDCHGIHWHSPVPSLIIRRGSSMKVLVVGSGGREHAVIRKLAENPEIDRIFCAPGNGGISVQAQLVEIKATDVEGMVAFAKKEGIDFVVVTPDDPLVLGMADAMEEAGIPAFGPSKKAAQIEGSKVFAKNLMKKYGIPTAKYEVFDDPSKVIAYIERENQFPAVIKADGLALGKGVVIARNLAEAKEAVHSIMEDKIFGKSGNQVVVEEFLTGKEVSVLAFTDSHTISPMISSMDHKETGLRQ